MFGIFLEHWFFIALILHVPDYLLESAETVFKDGSFAFRLIGKDERSLKFNTLQTRRISKKNIFFKIASSSMHLFPPFDAS